MTPEGERSRGGRAMFRIKLIHHVNVQISDRERARDWYTKVLGAEFLDRGPALNRRQLQLRLAAGGFPSPEGPNPAPFPQTPSPLKGTLGEPISPPLTNSAMRHVRPPPPAPCR